MHGGLSPELECDVDEQEGADVKKKMTGLDKINQIQRPCDVPDSGLLCDILWSDPDPSIEVSQIPFFMYLNVYLSFSIDHEDDFIYRGMKTMIEACQLCLDERL